MANDIDSLTSLTKSILNAKPISYDAQALDIPWRDVSGQKKTKLRIGILPEDPLYPLHPPVHNAMMEATDLLRGSGHELIPLTPEECKVAKGWKIVGTMLGFDTTGSQILQNGGESVVPSVMYVLEEAGRVADDELGLKDVTGMDRLDALSYFHEKRIEYADAWRELWKRHDLDAVMAPTSRTTAVEHDRVGVLPYTGFVSLLDVSQILLEI